MNVQKKLLMGVLLFALTLAFSVPLSSVKAYSDPAILQAANNITLTDPTTLVMQFNNGNKVTFKLTQKSSKTQNGVLSVITPNIFTYQNGDLEGCPTVTASFYQGRVVGATTQQLGAVQRTVKPQITVNPGDVKSKPTGPITGSLLIGNNNPGESGCPPFDNGTHAISFKVKEGVDTAGLTTGAEGGGAEEEAGENISCETGDSGPLGWILCPVIEMAATFTQFVFDNFVQPFLEDVPVTTKPGEGVYEAWKSFRLIGNIVLVGTMMAVVFAQVRGDR